tara:strand:+ start:659 stop:841 length:183 start_codon:yes stop_codon:yes gene_type:complete
MPAGGDRQGGHRQGKLRKIPGDQKKLKNDLSVSGQLELLVFPSGIVVPQILAPAEAIVYQ